MAEPAESTIVHNLLDAIDRLHDDLAKVELWAAALEKFRSPVPDYQPSDQHRLPPQRRELRGSH